MTPTVLLASDVLDGRISIEVGTAVVSKYPVHKNRLTLDLLLPTG